MKHRVLFINGVAARLRRVTADEFIETLPGGQSYDVEYILSVGPLDDTQVFVVPPGDYFVLGDNRDNSLDSRANLGYVARSDIIGKVAAKFFDGEKRQFVFEVVR